MFNHVIFEIEKKYINNNKDLKNKCMENASNNMRMSCI